MYLQIFLYLCTRKMNNTLQKIWKSPSVRNVGKLLSANIIAQVIGILVYPILTRMYAPEDFGLLNLFTSIGGVVTLIATSEYQYAIVLPKEDEKARALVHLSSFITLGVTIVLVLSIPFAGSIAGLFKAPELAHWWWAMPIYVAVTAVWNMLNYWYIRRKAFTRISGYQITQSTFSVAGKTGFGLLGWLRGGMIIAMVSTALLSLLVSFGLAWKKHLRELCCFSREEVRTVACEYVNFPKFNLPRAFVNSLALSLPIWLLTPAFGLESVGRLSLALMAAFVPLSIIAKACYQVLFQKVSEQVQQHRSLHTTLKRFTLWMSVAVAVGFPLIYLFVPQLVTFLFGADWIESATIIRRLFPFLILTPLCGAICFLSDVFAQQKTAMWMEVAYVAAMLIALLVGIYLKDFMLAICLYAWVRFAFLAIQLAWFVSLVRAYHKTLL